MIAEILGYGEENAKLTPIIMNELGITTQRELVQRVSIERSQGIPILSSSKGGYYLPDIDNNKGLMEIRVCINTIASRGRHTLVALKSLKQELERREILASGQTEIEGVKE